MKFILSILFFIAAVNSFAQQTDAMRTTVQLLGAKDGVLDAKDNLSNPILSITNPAVS